MLTKTPTSVWIHKRDGKRGTSYRLRWVNPRTGKWESLACGRDRRLALMEKTRIEGELREGLAGTIAHTDIGEFVEQLPGLMAPYTVWSPGAGEKRTA